MVEGFPSDFFGRELFLLVGGDPCVAPRNGTQTVPYFLIINNLPKGYVPYDIHII